MRAGLAYAILACSGWGFAFVGPQVLHDWPASAVAAGRYIAYGLWSVLALLTARLRSEPQAFDGGKWRDAILLSLAGNLLYYVLLSAAVQRAGVFLPTLIIGLLPLTVSMTGRLLDGQRLTLSYGAALALILAGLLLANRPAPGGGATDPLGLLYAFGALALWTGYGVLNAQWLRAHPRVGGLEWSSLQGAGVLPFALLLFGAGPALPKQGDWGLFIAISGVLGVLTSWAANSAWNLASQRLRASLLGQLIVIETIAGIAYGALWIRVVPSSGVLAGTALLIAGVVLAIREPA